MLVANQTAVQEARFAGHDKFRIAALCEAKPQSLAELSAHTRHPLGVTRVLLADKVADARQTVQRAPTNNCFTERKNQVETGLR